MIIMIKIEHGLYGYDGLSRSFGYTQLSFVFVLLTSSFFQCSLYTDLPVVGLKFFMIKMEHGMYGYDELSRSYGYNPLSSIFVLPTSIFFQFLISLYTDMPAFWLRFLWFLWNTDCEDISEYHRVAALLGYLQSSLFLLPTLF